MAFRQTGGRPFVRRERKEPSTQDRNASFLKSLVAGLWMSVAAALLGVVGYQPALAGRKKLCDLCVSAVSALG